jgi:hypothetical protein
VGTASPVAAEAAVERDAAAKRFERARRVPLDWTLLALGGLLFFAVVDLWLASRIVTPWIMIDELIYSDLARSVGDHGTFHVRGEPIPWSNFGYAVLLAPAWLVTETQATAYALAKAINVGLGVLAVVLVFVWARRLTTTPFALLAAGLTALMPSVLYAGTLMSENGFLPAFLLATLTIAFALERPTAWRQAFAFVAIGLACFIRVQGLILFAILPAAVLIASVLDARLARSGTRTRTAWQYLVRFWPTFASLAVLAVAYAAVKVAQGRPLSTGLGGYQVVAEADYTFAQAARWLARHVADLSLATGMFPVAALIVLVGLALVRGEAGRAQRAFLATTVAASGGIVSQASLFASSFAGRIEERNMFCVFPLLFVAFAIWLQRGAPRRPWLLAAIAAAAPAAAVVFALPLRGLLGLQILSDTFALIPLLRLSQLLDDGVDDVVPLLTVSAVAAALVFLLLPSRFRALLPLAMAAFFLLSSYAVHGAMRDYALQLDAGTSAGDRTWIDRAVGADQPVDYVYGAGYDATVEGSTLWQAEFWNRSLDDVFNIGIAPPFALTEVSAPLNRGNGRIQSAEPLDRYAVAAERLDFSGTVIARNGPLALYRVDQPGRVRRTLEGVYGDGWTSGLAALTQYESKQDGPLKVHMSRAAWIGPDVPGRVTVRVGPVAVVNGVATIGTVTDEREWVVHSGKRRTFTLNAPPAPYRVEVQVSPTFSPSRHGLSDTRELGVQLSVGQTS